MRRKNLCNFHTTYTSLCTPRIVFDFRRMFLAFYMFLTIGNTVFLHKKLLISITFSFPRHPLSARPKNHLKISPNDLQNQPPRSTKAHETGVGNHAHQNWTFCARSISGDSVSARPGPGKWTPVIYRYREYITCKHDIHTQA